MDIETRYDEKRGCGWRCAGGLYLMGGGPARDCGRLPRALTVCPTCHGGIKAVRSWTWVDADALFAGQTCRSGDCAGCRLSQTLIGRVGLMWIGEKFYQTPDAFLRESAEQGVSRRIPALPKDFVLGETWVLVAHRKAMSRACETASPHDDCHACGGSGFTHVPGVFQMFRPTAVEYVVKGDETEEQLERLRQRGITPVRVERLEVQAPLLVDA